MKSKKEIRENIFQKREELSEEYYKEATPLIHENLFELDVYKDSDTIFVYNSMGKELDTEPIIKKALEDGKRVALPRVISLKDGMMAHEYKEGDKLIESNYGAMEPSASAPDVKPQDIDLVIMPCVTCNNKGERVGYGGAFYDRFLTEVKGVRVLPYFSKLQTLEIPMESHDQKMDYVITEDSVVHVLK